LISSVSFQNSILIPEHYPEILILKCYFQIQNPRDF